MTTASKKAVAFATGALVAAGAGLIGGTAFAQPELAPSGGILRLATPNPLLSAVLGPAPWLVADTRPVEPADDAVQPTPAPVLISRRIAGETAQLRTRVLIPTHRDALTPTLGRHHHRGGDGAVEANLAPEAVVRLFVGNGADGQPGQDGGNGGLLWGHGGRGGPGARGGSAGLGGDGSGTPGHNGTNGQPGAHG
jgi:hypothetical protein